MVPLRHTLTEIGWHQPPSPIQCDNSTAVGMKNSTLVPRTSKFWDLHLNWLICIEPQKQFCYYWYKGYNHKVIIVQNITQLYTTRTKGLLDLRDVYII